MARAASRVGPATLAAVEPRRVVDQVIADYLARWPGAEFAHARDTLYRREVTLLRSALTLVDLGMEDEGIPEEVRVRVVRGALRGAIGDPAEAGERIDSRAALADAMARGVVPSPAPAHPPVPPTPRPPS